MQHLRSFLSILLCAALLAGCAVVPKEPTVATSGPDFVPVTVPTETEAIQKESLVIPGLSVEDAIRYFNEVCLNAEFINSGDPTRLQKWAGSIAYYVHGDPTEEDLQTLASFTEWLNLVPGFPGIYETQSEDGASLDIFFCTREELIFKLGQDFHNTDGGVTFWYNADNQIHTALICIRTDLDQQTRNSVILEEIYNGLGPIQDTDLRPDSIIYSGYSTPQELTGIDRLILQLLYHPDMVCGMNAAECEAVIRELYQ